MKFKIKKNSRFVSSRDAQIIDLCVGKKVLHIGATDAPYTEEKLEKGLLLHKKIDNVAQELLGIDIDEDAINYLQQKGFKNIITYNMNHLENLDFIPDVIIFGETIEHLLNLESALANLKHVMNENTILVVSTPNAMWLDKIIHTLKQMEHQHPDHKMIFSFATLSNLFAASELKTKSIYFTFLDREKESISKKLKKSFCRFFPGFSETLLFIVTL